jgi:hypothetical protein
MDQIDHIAGSILDLFRAVAQAVLSGLAGAEAALIRAMAPLHLTPHVESLVLLVVALLILLLVLRLFGGVLRFLLALVLIVVAVQVVVVETRGTDATLPPGAAPSPVAPAQQ